MGRGGIGAALVAGGLLTASALSGCTGDADEPAAKHSSSGSRTPTESATTAYPSGVPSGTELTEPGSELGLTEAATIAWKPRQDLVGTLQITVDSIEATTYRKTFRDWKVDKTTRTYSPYFVRAHVTNVGTTDLAGVPVPLYGESSADALVEAAAFKERFKPCNPSALPAPFAAGATTTVCLVYLVPAHGQLVGAAFRPTEEFEPIVWKPAAASSTGSPTASPTDPASATGTPSPTS